MKESGNKDFWVRLIADLNILSSLHVSDRLPVAGENIQAAEQYLFNS